MTLLSLWLWYGFCFPALSVFQLSVERITHFTLEISNNVKCRAPCTRSTWLQRYSALIRSSQKCWKFFLIKTFAPNLTFLTPQVPFGAAKVQSTPKKSENFTSMSCLTRKKWFLILTRGMSWSCYYKEGLLVTRDVKPFIIVRCRHFWSIVDTSIRMRLTFTEIVEKSTSLYRILLQRNCLNPHSFLPENLQCCASISTKESMNTIAMKRDVISFLQQIGTSLNHFLNSQSKSTWMLASSYSFWMQNPTFSPCSPLWNDTIMWQSSYESFFMVFRFSVNMFAFQSYYALSVSPRFIFCSFTTMNLRPTSCLSRSAPSTHSKHIFNDSSSSPVVARSCVKRSS